MDIHLTDWVVFTILGLFYYIETANWYNRKRIIIAVILIICYSIIFYFFNWIDFFDNLNFKI